MNDKLLAPSSVYFLTGGAVGMGASHTVTAHGGKPRPSARLMPVRVGLLLLLATFIGAPSAGWSSVDNSDRLIGLWGAELDFGPLIHGQLTIDGRGTEWRALVGGLDVAVNRTLPRIDFDLPAGAGQFRGHVAADRKTIVGQWIQPVSVVLFNRYATPVVLKEIVPAVWRGQIDPLQPHVSFYVSIQRSEAGALSARIRNPEFGWLQRGSYMVQANDGNVTFTGPQANNKFSGIYDAERDRLNLNLIDNSPPASLTRRSPENAIGFVPRTPPTRTYAYHQPIMDNDGWLTATLADVGLDSGRISALVDTILKGDPMGDATNVQSLLIARHGKLVFEEYFHGFSAERPHDMRSAGKTLAPVLVGIARDRGAHISPDTQVYSVFAAGKPFANWDDRKQGIRVKDLMSMTAGYDCDEDQASDAPGNEDVMQSQTAQPDWYKYTLDLPMAHDPGGERAYYCSAELNLTGGVAGRASAMPLADLFFEYFARPLQFHTYHLNLMPTGEVYMGGGAYIRARDQLKLGQFYLNGGTWNGRRILARDWVEQSLSAHARFGNWFGADHQYGWGWHILRLKVGDRVYTEYEAGGNGGQLVLILPELDMVVGFTGGAYGNLAAWGPWTVQLVSEYIIRAALQKRSAKPLFDDPVARFIRARRLPTADLR